MHKTVSMQYAATQLVFNVWHLACVRIWFSVNFGLKANAGEQIVDTSVSRQQRMFSLQCDNNFSRSVFAVTFRRIGWEKERPCFMKGKNCNRLKKIKLITCIRLLKNCRKYCSQKNNCGGGV